MFKVQEETFKVETYKVETQSAFEDTIIKATQNTFLVTARPPLTTPASNVIIAIYGSHVSKM